MKRLSKGKAGKAIVIVIPDGRDLLQMDASPGGKHVRHTWNGFGAETFGRLKLALNHLLNPFEASDDPPGKCQHYLKHNLLAQSLHELAYERNPGFVRFTKERSLPFRAHAEFKKSDLDARQQLYRRLAEDLWNPARLQSDVTEGAAA